MGGGSPTAIISRGGTQNSVIFLHSLIPVANVNNPQANVRSTVSESELRVIVASADLWSSSPSLLSRTHTLQYIQV